MVVGNETALSQNYAKRLLANSSVAQLGFLLMALVEVKDNGAPAVVFCAAVIFFLILSLGLLPSPFLDLIARLLVTLTV
jgi:NADH:ubiquinone oxidoreductase subunit 2 (subunit N)